MARRALTGADGETRTHKQMALDHLGMPIPFTTALIWHREEELNPIACATVLETVVGPSDHPRYLEQHVGVEPTYPALATR